MAALKQVGVREFRDQATKYLSGAEPIAVSKHGRIIGIYTPMQRDQEAIQQAVDQLGRTINRILEETGMSEDELVDLLDIRKPLP